MANKKSNSSNDLMGMIEEWFNKLPALPENGRKGLAGAMPWIALIFGILGVVTGIAGFGMLTATSPFTAMYFGTGREMSIIISSLIGLLGSVLLLISFPGVKAYKMSGWKFLFYSQIVWIISSVFTISLGGIIGDLIGLYLIFQIKKYYK